MKRRDVSRQPRGGTGLRIVMAPQHGRAPSSEVRWNSWPSLDWSHVAPQNGTCKLPRWTPQCPSNLGRWPLPSGWRGSLPCIAKGTEGLACPLCSVRQLTGAALPAVMVLQEHMHMVQVQPFEPCVAWKLRNISPRTQTLVQAMDCCSFI